MECVSKILMLQCIEVDSRLQGGGQRTMPFHYTILGVDSQRSIWDQLYTQWQIPREVGERSNKNER